MSTPVATRHLDPTPPRPTSEMPPPPHLACFRVEVDTVHLANPLLAVSRLLASEAGAYTHVGGDDDAIEICLALPGGDEAQRHLAEQWVRWAVHCAGVRGRVHPVTPSPGLRPSEAGSTTAP